MKLKIRYEDHNIRGIRPGLMLECDDTRTPTDGQLCVVQFTNGEMAVRRYFRRGGGNFLVTDQGDYSSPISRLVHKFAPVTRAWSDHRTRRLEPGQLRTNLSRIPTDAFQSLKRAIQSRLQSGMTDSMTAYAVAS